MMTPLLVVVDRAVKVSGLKPLRWAARAGVPKSTFLDLRRTGTCSGRTLAKLLKGGARVANRKVIESLDIAA